MGKRRKARDNALSPSDLRALARKDFAIFVELAFPILHRGKKLIHAQYIDVIGYLLEDITRGKIQRAVINLPPGYMKSMLVSVMYTAWRLGVDPTWKVVCISYGDDLAHRLSVLTRTLMLSPIYRKIFPGTILDKRAEDHLATTKGGFRYATQVGSDITGFRPNDIITDDPTEPEDGANELVKEKLRSWVASSVIPRLEDSAKGAIILVMHRIAPDDLSATFLKDKNCFHLSLPLVAEEHEIVEYRGKVIMERKPGDRLNPNRTSQDDIDQLFRETPRRVWLSLYQQRPILGGSGMLSIARLRRYSTPPSFELIMHSWDIAATITGNATVCTKYGVAPDKDGRQVAYLTDVVRFKLELPDVREAIRAQDALDTPDAIIIDHRGVGRGVVQELRQAGYGHVYWLDGSSNEGKLLRFAQASLAFYDGSIAFPEDAPFMEEVLYVLATFPQLQEFDLIDSITQLAAYLPYMLRYARQKRHGPRDDTDLWRDMFSQFK